MEYNGFRGVNKSVTPHLLQDGEVSDLRNLRSDQEKFRKRSGQTRIWGFDEYTGYLIWPNIIVGGGPGGGGPGGPILPVDGGSGGTGGGTTVGVIYLPHMPDWNDGDIAMLKPVLPDGDITVNQTFTLTITAYEFQTLSVLSDFDDGANASLTAVYFSSDFSSSTNATITDENGDPVDLTTGWSDGVWTGTVKVTTSLPVGESLVRLTVSYGGTSAVYGWPTGETIDADVWEDIYPYRTFTLTDLTTITRDVEFSLTITAYRDGAPDTSYEPGADLDLALTDADTGDELSASTVSKEGWASGAKTVSLTISGGTVDKTPTITVEESERGYTGSDSFSLSGETGNILEIILERQKAAIIGSGSWVDLGGSYTLTQLKAKVNEMAVRYLDESGGTYTGGSSAPTTYGATYADGATTEAELATLALALEKTLFEASSPDVNSEYWEGLTAGSGDADTYSDYVATMAATLSDYEYVSEDASGARYVFSGLYRQSYGVFGTTMIGVGGYYTSASRWNGRQSSSLLFLHAKELVDQDEYRLYEYDDQGIYNPETDDYWFAPWAATELAALAEYTSQDIYPDPSLFGAPTWSTRIPSAPNGPFTSVSYKGFQYDEWYVVFTYDFQYTGYEA